MNKVFFISRVRAIPPDERVTQLYARETTTTILKQAGSKTRTKSRRTKKMKEAKSRIIIIVAIDIGNRFIIFDFFIVFPFSPRQHPRPRQRAPLTSRKNDD